MPKDTKYLKRLEKIVLCCLYIWDTLLLAKYIKSCDQHHFFFCPVGSHFTVKFAQTLLNPSHSKSIFLLCENLFSPFESNVNDPQARTLPSTDQSYGVM